MTDGVRSDRGDEIGGGRPRSGGVAGQKMHMDLVGSDVSDVDPVTLIPEFREEADGQGLALLAMAANGDVDGARQRRTVPGAEDGVDVFPPRCAPPVPEAGGKTLVAQHSAGVIQISDHENKTRTF